MFYIHTDFFPNKESIRYENENIIKLFQGMDVLLQMQLVLNFIQCKANEKGSFSEKAI
jgi:hypothetical protein